MKSIFFYKIAKMISALLMLALTAGLRAEPRVASISFQLPDTNIPATLEIALDVTQLLITGSDNDTLVVEAYYPSPIPGDSVNAEIAHETEATQLALSDEPNLVPIISKLNALYTLIPSLLVKAPSYKISLPRSMAIRCNPIHIHDRLVLQNLEGDIDLNISTGNIILENVHGSLVVNIKGEGSIQASSAALPTKIIALTTEEGSIDLTLPADARANLQVRSRQGTINTDFTAAKLKTKTAKPPATSGKTVTGTLNGGGVAVTLATVSGKISLHQTTPAQTDPDETRGNVTVRFQDPEKFTDVEEDSIGSTSTYYLGELREYVQRIAATRLAPGQRLVITFLDIDLAGYVRPDRHNLRILTGASLPRAHLRFQLLDAGGQVLKEGEPHLSDPNYQSNISLIDRDDPLHYDKDMLRDWLTGEFRK